MSYLICLSLNKTLGHLKLYSQKEAERSPQKSLTILHCDLN